MQQTNISIKTTHYYTHLLNFLQTKVIGAVSKQTYSQLNVYYYTQNGFIVCGEHFMVMKTIFLKGLTAASKIVLQLCTITFKRQLNHTTNLIKLTLHSSGHDHIKSIRTETMDKQVVS